MFSQTFTCKKATYKAKQPLPQIVQTIPDLALGLNVRAPGDGDCKRINDMKIQTKVANPWQQTESDAGDGEDDVEQGVHVAAIAGDVLRQPPADPRRDGRTGRRSQSKPRRKDRPQLLQVNALPRALRGRGASTFISPAAFRNRRLPLTWTVHLQRTSCAQHSVDFQATLNEVHQRPAWVLGR